MRNRTSIDMQMRPSDPKSKTRTGWHINANSPVEENDVHAFEIREMIRAGFIARREIVQRTIVEVADVFDRDRVPGADGPRQHGHARIPVAVVARLLPEPPGEE